MNLKDIEQAAYTAPVVVSDEMVRIALDEYYPLFIPSDTAFEDMRRALTAVIPHLTAALSSAPSSEATYREAYEDAVVDALNVCDSYDDISRAEVKSGIKKLRPNAAAIRALSGKESAASPLAPEGGRE